MLNWPWSMIDDGHQLSMIEKSLEDGWSIDVQWWMMVIDDRSRIDDISDRWSMIDRWSMTDDSDRWSMIDRWSMTDDGDRSRIDDHRFLIVIDYLRLMIDRSIEDQWWSMIDGPWSIFHDRWSTIIDWNLMLFLKSNSYEKSIQTGWFVYFFQVDY
jgi:hypothetical protein